MNKIAEFIKENRKAAGLTQEEFAVRTGPWTSLCQRIGAGKRNGKDG